MKLDMIVRQAVDACWVRLAVDVRYDEEDMPNSFPGRSGDTWTVWVGLDSGELRLADGERFPLDVEWDLHMKVVDTGAYQLLDSAGNAIGEERQNYVPNFFPGSHYGDYLIFDIAGGKVANWPKKLVPLAVSDAFGLLDCE